MSFLAATFTFRETVSPFPSTGVRERLEAEADRAGMEALLQRLREIDPEAAERLHLSDRKRIIRALEVYLETIDPYFLRRSFGAL